MDKNTIKYIKSLQQKKYRQTHGKFIVEGVKMVNELTESDFHVLSIYSTEKDLLADSKITPEIISEKDLTRISSLKNPNKLLAIAEIPEKEKQFPNIDSKLSLILENIQDPGNMGTIIRIANWYGIDNIFCSENTVDCYNPKVVQATMGALFRVKVHYLNIYDLIKKHSQDKQFGIYATHLQGDNIHNVNIKKNGFIILGNESKGISDELSGDSITKIKLPSYPPGETKMESLNVGVATAVALSEFRREKS